jgi:hypothetical protein
MSNKPPPLVGYNTNVRHDGNLFHIQTEDSGVEHPHIITHLFVAGTILATKKQSYKEFLDTDRWDARVRAMMKDQHKAMFIELRDGAHDEVAARIFEKGITSSLAPLDATIENADTVSDDAPPEATTDGDDDADAAQAGKEAGVSRQSRPSGEGVRVIRPASMNAKQRGKEKEKAAVTPKSAASIRQRSIFDTPADDGEFGENLITDKSLDEVILSYLTDELDE